MTGNFFVWDSCLDPEHFFHNPYQSSGYCALGFCINCVVRTDTLCCYCFRVTAFGSDFLTAGNFFVFQKNILSASFYYAIKRKIKSKFIYVKFRKLTLQIRVLVTFCLILFVCLLRKCSSSAVQWCLHDYDYSEDLQDRPKKIHFLYLF